MMLLLTRVSCFWPLGLHPSACHLVYSHYQPRTKTNLAFGSLGHFHLAPAPLVLLYRVWWLKGLAATPCCLRWLPLSLVTPESALPQCPPERGANFTGLNFTGLNLTGPNFTGFNFNPATTSAALIPPHKPPCG